MNEELLGSNESLEELEAALSSRAAQIDELQRVQSQQQAEIESQRDQYAGAMSHNDELQCQLEQGQTYRDELLELLASYRRDLDALRERFYQMETSASEQANDLKSSVADMEGQILELQSKLRLEQLNASKSSAESKQQQTELHISLQDLKQQHASALTALSESKQQQVALNAIVEEAEQRLATTQQQLGASLAALSEAKAELISQTIVVNDCKQQYTVQTADLQALNEAHRRLQADFATLSGQSDVLRSQLEDLRQELALEEQEHSDERDALLADNERLQESVLTLQVLLLCFSVSFIFFCLKKKFFFLCICRKYNINLYIF